MRLAGKRVRAAQARAALFGLDHHAVRWPDRAPGPESFADAAGGTIAVVSADELTGPTNPASDIIVLTAPGHSLTDGACAILAHTFAAHPERLTLYGDALVHSRGAFLPILRPAFDADYLRAFDYIGPVVAIRRTALDAVGGLDDLDPQAPAFDALLRLAASFGGRAIGHLPTVLSRFDGACETTMPPAGEGGRDEEAARLTCVRRDLERGGRSAVEARLGSDGVITLARPLPEPPPRVSLIVPTRDRLDLLRPCLDSLRYRTDWPDREILICDNDSRDPETLAYLAALTRDGIARVVPCPGPFDFAAMNNRAAAAATGRVLAFVNNDVAATDPTWLDRMVREALRPEIGAVGARLIDGRGRIQHGGVILGPGGLVTHAHRFFPGDAPGYLSSLRATRRVSAVTAACLVVEASKFRDVGGFDAAAFAVDFNDVDLCLRLNAAGHHSLYVGGAILTHDEAASRRWTPQARARHEGEVAAFKKRWGPLLTQDPHYHPGFDPDLGTYARLRSGWPETGPVAPR
ncbi:glycosyltransferase [Methylobacterium gossipiicola]|uniref:Glycosyltransferase, GT2 family n=1 Tax=Methylobacterium gossipiicola TaxID=582675 RepID=A0A1I2VE77_9HYPH|nr:glycosyltransferase [Methylobacterium gossipiicola]SFG87383.1 Glycosyltransferase, GT2 family [Methylobacterium gossipiicola]